ncbi:hypothetical protein [Ammoniphilus sp. 3BR4]|uniref:BC1872 family protein n=1 Tax=Ammoniphilus sp. 3BR4 TaxID=3158265 RepID=UPI003466ABB8
MKAGRTMDALIAERVMGKKVDRSSRQDIFFEEGLPIPQYSTNIADAWLVVERFENVEVEKFFHAYTAAVHVENRVYSVQADTAPSAICLAALKAEENS